MQYLLSFLEGVITFLSPCLLPMLPVYLSYFTAAEIQRPGRALRGALGFVLGFSVVFVALGGLAGAVGGFFSAHQRVVNLVCGLLVILFGLSFLGVVRLDFFRGFQGGAGQGRTGFGGALLLGVVFSVGWTPCVGAFLGSALLLASQRGHALEGMGMLLCYSLGLGVPFVLSALLIGQLQSAFAWVKGHYGLINQISGGLLIALGVLMATGALERVLALLG